MTATERRMIVTYADFVAASLCSLNRWRYHALANIVPLGKAQSFHGKRCRFCCLTTEQLEADLAAARPAMHALEPAFAELSREQRRVRVHEAQDMSWIDEVLEG